MQGLTYLPGTVYIIMFFLFTTIVADTLQPYALVQVLRHVGESQNTRDDSGGFQMGGRAGPCT